MFSSNLSGEYVVKPLSDLVSEIDGYKFYLSLDLHPQCMKCWEVLEIDFDKETQTARIYKCKQEACMVA